MQLFKFDNNYINLEAIELVSGNNRQLSGMILKFTNVDYKNRCENIVKNILNSNCKILLINRVNVASSICTNISMTWNPIKNLPIYKNMSINDFEIRFFSRFPITSWPNANVDVYLLVG